MQDTDLTVLKEILAQQRAELDPQKQDAEFFEFFAAQQALRDYQLDPEEINVRRGRPNNTARFSRHGRRY